MRARHDAVDGRTSGDRGWFAKASMVPSDVGPASHTPAISEVDRADDPSSRDGEAPGRASAARQTRNGLMREALAGRRALQHAGAGSSDAHGAKRP